MDVSKQKGFLRIQGFIKEAAAKSLTEDKQGSKQTEEIIKDMITDRGIMTKRV